MKTPENQVISKEMEHYQLVWPGKNDAIKLADSTSEKKIHISEKDSTLDSQNLYIEGDNLDALKLLRPTYSNSIKMIYIDPPYNTGNAFIYEDDFGNNHTAWLNMIYPRLKIAKELMTEDGAIFISIDEGEIHNLKIICNEIFKEENYINTFMWLHGKGKKDSWSRTLQQYVIAYAKNKTKLAPWTEKKGCDYKFKNPDNDPKGPWFSGSLSFSEKRSNPKSKNYYSVISPSGVKWTRQWMVPEEKMKEMISNGDISFGKAPDYKGVPRSKIRPEDEIEIIPNNIIEDCNSTRGAEKYLTTLFGSNCFSYPKPYELIKKLASFMNLKNQIVLDFFSGSATTAEAVIRLNIENKDSNTKFIMVQQPENLDNALNTSTLLSRQIIQNAINYLDSKKLPHNLCEIGKERIRLAVKKLQHECKDNINHLDLEFKTLKIN